MIDVVMDGKQLRVPRGTTILEAARGCGIEIPTLCHHEGLPPDGNCRICTVEVEERGGAKLVASCMYPIRSELRIETRSERVLAARCFVIQLLFDRNPKAIPIVRLAKEYGVERGERFASEPDLCIRCARCIRACEAEGNCAIQFARTGFVRYVTSPYDAEPRDCIGCLACATVCPTGKIVYREDAESRTIWGRRFELAACGRCGARYATPEQLVRAGEMVQNACLGAGGEVRLCDRCRKAVFGSGFRAGV